VLRAGWYESSQASHQVTDTYCHPHKKIPGKVAKPVATLCLLLTLLLTLLLLLL
jgi:hypothetical protein